MAFSQKETLTMVSIILFIELCDVILKRIQTLLASRAIKTRLVDFFNYQNAPSVRV